MERQSWESLPAEVQDAVQGHCGRVHATVNAPAGAACDFAATLYTGRGRVFCKGAHRSNPRAWMLVNEARVNPWLPVLAPRLLWETEVGPWHMCGFEHARGRHADLSPSSPDLAVIAEALGAAAADVREWPIAIQPIEHRWRHRTWESYLADPPVDLDRWERQNLRALAILEATGVERLAGDRLAHTDPVAANFLVDGQQARIVDWAWPARAAPWIDTAFLVMSLIEAGHSVASAEAWAATVPHWEETTSAAVDAFVVMVTGLWEHQARFGSAPHSQRLASVARLWLQHRFATA